ncbi:ribosomal protein L7Ae/L30e/S12e/Gadd45 [Tanacetum coccineum]
MTPTKGMEAIKELSAHSFSWYNERDIKTKNKEFQIVLNQIHDFENNMNIMTVEVKMAQHKRVKTESGVSRKLATKPLRYKLLLLRGLANAITTKSGLNYKPPKNPLENVTTSQEGLTKKETTIKNGDNDPGKVGIDKALADLGANISLMPYFMYARLDLGELKPNRVCIELANKSTQYPRGIVENVIIKIDKYIFPVDFVVLDMKEDHNIPIILGRPFLATTHAMIDVFNKKISFEVGNETITFDIEKSMKFSTPKDDECLSVDLIDNVVSNLVKEILPSSTLDSFLFEPILNFQQNSTNLWEEEDNNSEDLDEAGLPSDHDNWEPIKQTLSSTNTIEAEKQSPKLKELPFHLEYALLNNNQEFPVIISFLLNSQEKESLLKVLTEDNFKPVVQPQRRLNPKVQDVVKAEIVKLLDSELIYAISDSDKMPRATSTDISLSKSYIPKVSKIPDISPTIAKFYKSIKNRNIHEGHVVDQAYYKSNNIEPVITNEWDLGCLEYSQETEGPYSTDLLTPDDIRRLLELERVMQWEELIRENVFGLGGHRDHLPACLAHMLYCVVAEEQYNLAYFFVKRIECARENPTANLPYGMFLTRLYRHIMEVYPHLDNGIYDIVDRVMRPLDLKQTRRSRSDRGKACHSISSSSSHHHGTSSHQNDDDDDDVETSRASTPSPTTYLNSLDPLNYQNYEMPSPSEQTDETLFERQTTLLNQMQETHKEMRGGFKSFGNALKGVFSKKKK